MKVLFITNVPSPYRVDFFNEIGKYVDLTVLFERNNAKSRNDEWMSNNFKNFKYHIDSSSQSQDGTAATVTVSITNLDAKALATDLCQAIYQNSLNYGSSADQSLELQCRYQTALCDGAHARIICGGLSVLFLGNESFETHHTVFF